MDFFPHNGITDGTTRLCAVRLQLIYSILMPCASSSAALAVDERLGDRDGESHHDVGQQPHGAEGPVEGVSRRTAACGCSRPSSRRSGMDSLSHV